MILVNLHWFTADGGDISLQRWFATVPCVGDSLDLSDASDDVKEWHEAEARHLGRMNVKLVEHASTRVLDKDFDQAAPSVVLQLERDLEDDHRMQLEDARELLEWVQVANSRLRTVLNLLAQEFLLGGKFGLVAHEGAAPGPDLLVYQCEQFRVGDVPLLAMEVADAVYLRAEVGFRCVKHRFRKVPFECSWTGVVA